MKDMRREGFALLEILIVIVLITLLFGGGFYLTVVQQQQATIQIGEDAKKKALDIKRQMEAQSARQEDVLHQIDKLDTLSPQ